MGRARPFGCCYTALSACLKILQRKNNGIKKRDERKKKAGDSPHPHWVILTGCLWLRHEEVFSRLGHVCMGKHQDAMNDSSADVSTGNVKKDGVCDAGRIKISFFVLSIQFVTSADNDENHNVSIRSCPLV